MAEINGLGDIQNGVEHISEVLDSMRAQNAMNSGDMDKVLANINSRLETLSNDDDSDLIKVYLAELKRSLDERHNFVSTKFGEIEGSFKNLVDNAGQALKADELRQVFDIIATNLNVSSKEVASQKDLLTELSLKMEDLKQDESTKKDILKNISVLKVEIEKFNNGFESIIVSLNDNFQEVSRTLLKIDPTGALDSVKKDIENIFLSSNAVLSALQLIDRKNRDLEEVLNHVVTKEDFVLERDQVAKLISQNIQLTDYINKLPTVDSLTSLSQKVDTAVGIINALKNVLNETSDQNQKMLVAQLDNLETKISNISSEEEFVGFKKELSAFAQEIIQSTNLMRADLMNTNSELQGLVSFLGAMDIKNTFEHFSGLAQIAEENIKVNLNEMTEKFLKETQQTRSIVAGDVKGNLQNVEQKIDSVERNIVEASKNNFMNILEGIQSVLSNVFAMKTEIKLENIQNAESFDEKLQDLRDGVFASKDTVVVNLQQNLQILLDGIQTLSGELESAKEGLCENSKENFENILSVVERFSQEISVLKDGLNVNSQENLETILSNINRVSKEVFHSQGVMTNSSRENLESILSSVSQLSGELSSAKEGLSSTAQENFDNIYSIVDNFSLQIDALSEHLSTNSQSNFERLKEITGELSVSLVTFKNEVQVTAKSNTAWLKSTIDALSQELQLVKDGLETKSQVNFENITNRISEISTKIEEAQDFTNTNLSENISELKSSISALPAFIQENQTVFEDEKRVLIEQNSKNIEELIVKIQNLTKGIVSKDNPFKEEVIFEFANLNNLLRSVQEDLSQKNVQAYDEIKANIRGLEGLVSQVSSGSEVSLYNLQTKLAEYLQLIQDTTQSSDLKLENSINEIVEIKTQIEVVREGIEALNSDETLGEMSRELSSKLEGILFNILRFEDNSSQKNQDNLQNTLTFLEEQFQAVITSLQNTLVQSQVNTSLNSKAEVFEMLDKLEATLILNQSDAQYSIMEKIEHKIDEKDSLIRDNFEELISLKAEMLEEINNAKDETGALIKGKGEELISLKSDMLEEINNAKDETGALIKGKVEELISLKSDMLEEISNAQGELQRENLSLVKNSIDEFTVLKSELLEKIVDSTSEFHHENADKIDYIQSEMAEILKEISRAQECLSEHKLDIAQLLKIKDEDVISQFSSIENTIMEGISQNVEEFKTKVEITAQAIEDKISMSENNYKSSTQAMLGDIKSSFSSNVEENFDDLKSFIEVVEGRKDFNLIIDNLKADVFEKFSILADDLEDAVSNISVKKDLDELRVGVEASVNDLMETLYDRIVLAIKDDNVTQDVLEKSEEITRRVEDLKRVVTDDVADKLDGFELSLDRQSTDFSNLISEIAVSLVELKENYVDLSLNSSMEISNLLSSVNDKIDDVSSKLHNYDFGSIIESAKSQMLEEIASVKDSVSSIDFAGSLSEDFQTLYKKLDVINIGSDDLESDISDIKDSISSQSKFIEDLKALEHLDKLSKLDGISDIQNEIKNTLSLFEGNLNAISSQNIESKADSSEIKHELNTSRKELIECVLNLFDQISFVVEAEDIKYFVEEKAEEVKDFVGGQAEEIKADIKESLKSTLGANFNEILSSLEILHGKEKNSEGGYSQADAENIKDFIEVQADEIKANIKEDLKSSLGDNFNDILSSLEILHDKAKMSDGGYHDIKNEITDVKKHIQQLQNTSEESDYSYTLQDIESDIAKVRLILNDISQSKSEGNFDQKEMMTKLGRLNELDKLDSLDRLSGLDKLGGLDKMNEDIISISNRTNRLLLTSDESYTNLKVNLDDFRNVVYNLEEKVRYLDSTEATNRIETKIETVNQLAISCVKSDKIFNQAFTYLAEWVDSASENMASIIEKVEKVTEIDEVKQSIAEIKKTVSKKADLAAMLDEISDKFEQQQVKIERLEEKIDDLSNIGSQSSSQFDLKAIVAEVLAQVAGSAPIADSKLIKKVDTIDKQLVKMGKNIEKLTSYVDAE